MRFFHSFHLLWKPSLQQEITITISDLQRQLIQAELNLRVSQASVALIKSKLEYLKTT